MACEICGRSSCCKSFHSIEEQDSFDNIADNVKSRMINSLVRKIGGLNGHFHGNNYYVNVDLIVKEIENYD